MIGNNKTAKHLIAWLVGLPFLALVACTEDITIDSPEEKIVPVVEGYLTNEYKRHEVILSYSSELYSHETTMITGAKVFVTYNDNKDNRRFHRIEHGGAHGRERAARGGCRR